MFVSSNWLCGWRSACPNYRDGKVYADSDTSSREGDFVKEAPSEAFGSRVR